jgi:EAL domain-containing protein (putative c-di-GMP-specific phosphodiesterase class I)
VTETLYIEALDDNTATLDGLKKLGVRISIDDFGIGYSSLSRATVAYGRIVG